MVLKCAYLVRIVGHGRGCAGGGGGCVGVGAAQGHSSGAALSYGGHLRGKLPMRIFKLRTSENF